MLAHMGNSNCRSRVITVLLFVACAQYAVDAASFVTRSGNQLYVDGKPFYHLGFNAVWMPSSVAFGQTKRVDDVLDAAQRLGLKTLRTWGFNDAFPSSPGKYQQQQGQGLDYVIAGAGRRGMRVVLALANFWPAYLGPEAWLAWAEGLPVGATNGKTVADFYRSQKALNLLKEHIYAITSRVNTLTGVAYKSDPTIMGYNLFNEPRCPGCTEDDMAARNAFISALAATLKAAAPNQLTFSGTEGFFAAGDPQVGLNPGPASQCEGEDWTSEIKLFDVATTHMYWRQMEVLKQTGGSKPGFDFYIQPLVIEEFGLTRRFFSTEEQQVVVAVVASAVVAARQEGKPLMGAWLWQAAPPGDPDVGGYDIPLTSALTVSTSSPTDSTAVPSNTASGSNTAADGGRSNGQNTDTDSNGATSSSGNTDSTDGRSSDSTKDTSNNDNDQPSTGRRLTAAGPLVVDQSMDSLDSFRRGTERGACAAGIRDWPEVTIPVEVDVGQYRNKVAQQDFVDIIAQTARRLG